MRVISGRFGGRTLVAPRGAATRPTSDRVREALFAVLGDLTGLRVADLYAGTGALGIEALSRGASWVTFVESNRAALAALRTNVERLGLGDQVAIVGAPVGRARAALTAHGPYDLVLCDPPWAEVERAVAELGRALPTGALGPHARLVLEHRAGASIDLPAELGSTLLDQRSWGDTGVSIFGAKGQEKPDLCSRPSGDG